MNAEHDAEHERLLESLCTGEKPFDDGARASIERCPTCAKEWGELGALRTRLDRQAHAERALLEQVQTAPLTEEQRRLLEDFRRSVAPGRKRSSGPWSRWGLVGALAAASVAAYLFWGREQPAKPAPVFLASDGIEFVGPVGSVKLDGPLEFTARLQTSPDERFEIRVFRDDGSGTQLDVRAELAEPRAQWSYEQVKSWNARTIVWELWGEELGRRAKRLGEPQHAALEFSR